MCKHGLRVEARRAMSCCDRNARGPDLVVSFTQGCMEVDWCWQALDVRLRWLRAHGRSVILLGDLNIAPTPLDQVGCRDIQRCSI